ncbi:MAG: ATP-binding protein [Calditrichia bacterium]
MFAGQKTGDSSGIPKRQICEYRCAGSRDRHQAAASQKIFDDYYRANDKAAANIAGTGLGLPLVKRIAEAHHGAVTVESSYGEGSVFTLKLPISE